MTPSSEATQVRSERSYRRLKEIASGGMGTVELVVRQEGRFQRLLALKRLRSTHRDEADLRAMFLEEARLAGLLRHPNVVSVFDVGEDEDGPFLVMDYVDGMSASQVMRESPVALPPSVCLEIAMLAARGLHAAHELVDEAGRSMELVHRDVSPQNILIAFDGTVHVSDFGIAKATGQSTKTSTGVLKGKLGYMAPEILLFEKVDRRADIFALGVVLYELLTNARLYGAARGGTDTNADQSPGWRILHEPAPDIGLEREDVPPELVELLMSMLAKSPSLRPGTARDVELRLRDIREHLRMQGGGDPELPEFMAVEFADRAASSRRETSWLLQSSPVTAEASPDEGHASARPARVAAALLFGFALVASTWALVDDSAREIHVEKRAVPPLARSAPEPVFVPPPAVEVDTESGENENLDMQATRRAPSMRPSPMGMARSPRAPAMAPAMAMAPAERPQSEMAGGVESALRRSGITPW